MYFVMVRCGMASVVMYSFVKLEDLKTVESGSGDESARMGLSDDIKDITVRVTYFRTNTCNTTI